MKSLFENIKYGKGNDNSFLAVCSVGALEKVRACFETKTGLYQTNKSNGYNGFLIACMKGNLEIVKFLFENDCGIDHVGNHGLNGFMISCILGKLEIVKFLFEKECAQIIETEDAGRNGFMLATVGNNKLSVWTKKNTPRPLSRKR